MASMQIFQSLYRTFTSMLNYCSRSEVALTTITENRAQSSRSTPELRQRASSTESNTSVSSETSGSSWTTDDTLSMISTPWTTESWVTGNSCDDAEWYQCEESSTSYFPKTSDSYEFSTLLNSLSQATLTVFSVREVDADESQSIRPAKSGETFDLSSTFSSWTLETFTSAGWLSDVESGVVQVNYPWSPFTVASCSDSYPSSLLTKSHFSCPSCTTLDTDVNFLNGLDVTNEDHSTVLVV